MEWADRTKADRVDRLELGKVDLVLDHDSYLIGRVDPPPCDRGSADLVALTITKRSGLTNERIQRIWRDDRAARKALSALHAVLHSTMPDPHVSV